MTKATVNKNSAKIHKHKSKTPKTGFFWRIIGVILWPVELMKNLMEKPRTFFSIFMISLSIPFYWLIRLPLFAEFCQSIAQNNIDINAENYLEELARATLLTFTGLLVLTPIYLLFSWLLGSLVLFFMIKIFKGQATYKKILSITGYSYVIILFSIIIQLIISFITRQLYMDASLANIIKIFYPTLQATNVYNILRGIDIFSVWRYFVIGIGVLYMSKLSKIKVATIITVIYALDVMLNAGINAYI